MATEPTYVCILLNSVAVLSAVAIETTAPRYDPLFFIGIVFQKFF